MIVMVVGVLLPARLFAATEIHIAPAPAGDDGNPGTVAQPVATPQAAQTLVRSLITAGLTDVVDVIFAAGTYHLATPLELRPEDSGTATFPITWKAAASATVVLSGGKPITATWIDGGSGIWHVDLAGVGLGASDWNFRQLFVGGTRINRARFPNADEANPFLYATGGGVDHAVINPALTKASWGTATDAQINIVAQWKFFNQWNTVTAVNTGSGRIDFADSERHGSITSGNWFWIEGVLEELDQPGEWFLDTTSGRLHYMPESGVDPNTLDIVAPFLNRIVNAQGDVNAGTHVAHVHFDGLEFRHATFTLGHIEARVHTDTAVMFENTNDSSVKNCHFENIGGYALWLHLDSQRNIFDRNSVRHSGGGGVLMTGSRLSYMDDTKVYTPGEAAAKVAPILNEVTYNTVEHCGKLRYYGGGVHLDSRPFNMSMAPGNYIAHNYFNDLSRNGVFAFRNQGGNVVEYNHIHNAMQTTIDGACIHFATMNHLNAPNFILNNWLYDIWGYEQKPNGTPVRHLANGIFLDWDSSNTTVKDNWIYNAGGAAVKVIWNNWNVVNSGNQSSSTVITPPFVAEVGPGGTATHGIDLANNKLTGSTIHYTETAHFSTTGTWTPDSAVGLSGLFMFNFLVGTAAVPSEAVYTLPITEDGTYQISLLYKPGGDRASNVPVAITHADGTANLSWNMQQGSTHGFAVELGTYRFESAETNTVTLSTTGANGKVIADAVAFVKIEDNVAPVASNVQVAGSTEVGNTLTVSYDYSDANNDLQGASQFQWYRSDDAVFDVGDVAIPNATNQSYVIQVSDIAKYLFAEVTPVALTGVSSGAAARSPASDQVASNVAPTATAVSLVGMAAVGSELTGVYTYGDADGNAEGASIYRWYRSDDAVLDAGDTVVAGAVIEVTPTLVKTSTSLSSARLASNLFTTNGMSASGDALYNLDGSLAGEPTSADLVSWVTTSGGESSMLASAKTWFVADLGASYPVDNVHVWNFQWNHSSGDLSDRGISQFDLYLRNSAADTTDGTPGGSAINTDGSAATFNLGSANQWQAVLVDQALAKAPNNDSYTGEKFLLAGQTGRFLAIVADNYHGGNGIGLGKVRVQIGQTLINYTPVAADLGKYLIFEVTPVASTGLSPGAAATAVVGPVAATEFESSWNGWLDEHFSGETDVAVIGKDANPDGDDSNNLSEFFGGGDPNVVDAVPGISISEAGGSGILLISSEPNPVPSPLTIRWQTSENLTGWADIETGIQEESRSAAGNGYADVSYRYSPPGTPARMFIRRVVELAAP